MIFAQDHRAVDALLNELPRGLTVINVAFTQVVPPSDCQVLLETIRTRFDAGSLCELELKDSWGR